MPSPNDNNTLFKKNVLTFRALLKPYRGRIAGLLILILGVNLLALALPWAIKIIIDDILINKKTASLNVIVLALAGILVLRSVLGFGRAYLSGSTGERIVCDLRQKIYDHIPRLSLKSINAISPAQILTRLTQDVGSVRRFLFGDAVESIYAFFNMVFIATVLFFVNARLTVVSLLALPLFAVIYLRLLPELKERHSRLRGLHGLLSSRINEVLNGIRVVRSFAGGREERRLFEERQRDILGAANRTHYLNAWLWIAIECFASLGMTAILWIGGGDVIAGKMTAGELVAFYTYLGMLFAPVVRLVVINTSYQEALAALNRVNDVMTVDDEVTLSARPVAPAVVEGRVAFQGVGFHYTDGEPVLKEISFCVEPGQTIGIVGASGAGKTTLVSLLLRFFDPDRGKILIDGRDLKDLDLEAYRRKTAVVLQDDFLFSGTIADNIRYGRPGASRGEMVQAAKVAQAHPFIRALAGGYETQVGERGVNLSSGQRQRIAIARAVLKNPSILILDEATSSIDALTENAIQQSVREFMKGKTVFLVAHRFSTIIESDQIIVIDRGRIVERGGHHDLLTKRGFYSHLYVEQFREEDRLALADARNNNRILL